MTFEPKLGSTAVVKVTLLLADINDFAKVNEVYKTCKSTGVMIPLMTRFRGFLLMGCLIIPTQFSQRSNQPGQPTRLQLCLRYDSYCSHGDSFVYLVPRLHPHN